MLCTRAAHEMRTTKHVMWWASCLQWRYFQNDYNETSFIYSLICRSSRYMIEHIKPLRKYMIICIGLHRFQSETRYLHLMCFCKGASRLSLDFKWKTTLAEPMKFHRCNVHRGMNSYTVIYVDLTVIKQRDGKNLHKSLPVDFSFDTSWVANNWTDMPKSFCGKRFSFSSREQLM